MWCGRGLLTTLCSYAALIVLWQRATLRRFSKRNIERAVLSAVAHGKDPDKAIAERVARAATAACRGIDEERSKLYLDLIDVALKHGAPEALEVVMNSLGYEYQGDFARRYVAEGRAEGRAEGVVEGRTGTILRLLARRFGPLSEADQTRVRGAGEAALDKVEDAMMKSATTLDEVLGLLKWISLSAPEALEVFMISLGNEHQGDFARRYVAEGRAEAFAEGQMTPTIRTEVRGARGGTVEALETLLP